MGAIDLTTYFDHGANIRWRVDMVGSVTLTTVPDGLSFVGLPPHCTGKAIALVQMIDQVSANTDMPINLTCYFPLKNRLLFTCGKEHWFLDYDDVNAEIGLAETEVGE